METVSRETAELAAYMADASQRPLPEEVRERTALHTLDTLAAVISGSRMPAGSAGRRWAERSGGGASGGPSSIVGGGTGTPVAAGLCNGMAAHADETDDSHMETLSHPGCAVVPAAMAAAEDVDASGAEMLRAVAAGYDVGCRVGRAVGLVRSDLRSGQRSSHALVGAFGAMAAAATLYRFDARQVRHALSYTAQLTSGVTTWMRDTEHVEKAFVFAGMPASQGLLAVSLVAAGCSGVEDVLAGAPNWLDAVSSNPDRSALIKGLGSDYEVLGGTLKKYSVGSPAQAAVEAVVEMIRDEGLSAQGVDHIKLQLPVDSAVIVDSRTMPAINVQYLVAGTLLDGAFSFAMAHDEPRMQSPAILDLIGKMVLVPDEALRGQRDAVVTVERHGSEGAVSYSRHVDHVRGTSTRPMTAEEVRAKALDLIAPSLGVEQAAGFCNRVIGLSEEESVRSLFKTTLASMA